MRRLLALPAALVAVLACAGPAFAHAAFAGSDPAPGQRLDSSPTRLTLQFTEPLNRGLASAALRAPDGSRVVATAAAQGSRLVLVPARPLGTGVYTVRWHTVSDDDGHALEGTFAFGVRADARATQATETGPFAHAGAARMLARLALYATLLMLAAALLLPRIITRPHGWPVPDAIATDLGGGATPAGAAGPATAATVTGAAGAGVELAAARARMRRLTGDLAWLAVAAAVASALADAADAAEGLAPHRLTTFLLGGLPGLARVAVVVAALAAAALRERAPRAAAATAALALAAVAASGHAASAEPRWPSVLNDWVHLLSGALWLGGIALLVALWWPSLRFTSRPTRLAVARRVLAPFGPVALGAFAVVVATGAVSLLTQVGRLSALYDTAYGRVLAVKIVIVGLIAVVSWAHALRLRPRLLAVAPAPRAPERTERRHWRLWRSEPWLALLVVASVAALVAFPLPPRQLDEAGSTAQAAVCDPCPLPRPAADELGIAGQAGSQLVAAWIRRSPTAVTGTVRVLDSDGRPSRVPIELPGASSEPCGEGCRRFRLPRDAAQIPVAVRERGRRYATTLPAIWKPTGSARARRLLHRAQSTMRALTGVRENERLTSGPGSLATTEYRLRAPDRLAWETGRGVRSVVVGKRQWLLTPATSWRGSEYGSGLPFRTRTYFTWESYARSVRLLDERTEGGRRIAELALMDEGTPVWFRLTVDERTHHVLGETMAAKARFSQTTFTDFGRRFTIRPPAGVP